MVGYFTNALNFDDFLLTPTPSLSAINEKIDCLYNDYGPMPMFLFSFFASFPKFEVVYESKTRSRVIVIQTQR